MGNMSKGPDATDYSKTASWYRIPEITKGIDTFFVYPTEYLGLDEGDPAYAALDNPDMREGVEFDHLVLASVCEDSTNLFMPYYRQASARTLGDAWKDTGDIRTALALIPYAYVTAALDFYFDNYNGGRPFIIAGHSQGSAIVTPGAQGLLQGASRVLRAHGRGPRHRLLRHEGLSGGESPPEVRGRRERCGRHHQLEHRGQGERGH